MSGSDSLDAVTGKAVSVVITAFTILLVITSLLLIVLVLLHKGRGGGLSDMFGGGVSSGLGGSSVAERNLDRITIGIGADLVRVHHRARPAAQVGGMTRTP